MEGAKASLTLKRVSDVFQYSIHKCQRTVNNGHIKNILEDQIHQYNQHKSFTILQAISVAHVANDKSYIIDGQHRWFVFKELENMGYNVKDVILPVVIYKVADEIEMLKFFNMINKNMPIHPLELQTDYVDCGKILVENMTKTFGVYMKHDNKNSRCPHINMNDFKKNLVGRPKLHESLCINNKTIDELWEKVLELNAYVKNNMKAQHQLCQLMNKRLTDCEQKATKCKADTVCYLGVWRRFEWFDFSLVALLENKSFASMNLSCDTNARIPIPIAVREQVWRKCNSNALGVCFTCGNELYFRDMECGHIKAHALGGDTKIDNLMPICKSCNGDMGVMDIFEYKAMIDKMSR